MRVASITTVISIITVITWETRSLCQALRIYYHIYSSQENTGEGIVPVLQRRELQLRKVKSFTQITKAAELRYFTN